MAANRTALDLFAVERLNGLLTKAATIDRIATDIVADIGDVVGAPGTWPGSGDDGGPQLRRSEGETTSAGGGRRRRARRGRATTRAVGIGAWHRADQPGRLRRGAGALRSGLRTYRFRSPAPRSSCPLTRYGVRSSPRSPAPTTYPPRCGWPANGLHPRAARLACGGAHTGPRYTVRHAEQAELVCFSDFPSWAEQADGAMRTVAHQLPGTPPR